MATQSSHDRAQLPDPLTRIEAARREVGHTEVRRSVARLLVVAFLMLIVAAPVAQLIMDPGFFTTARVAFRGAQAPAGQVEPRSALQALFDRNRSLLASIDRFDDLIADDSLVATVIRPPVQYLLTTLLGTGTEQVHQGTEEWLFFGPDVAYVTGNGFLTPAQLARRATSGNTLVAAAQPDPRPVIFDLHQQLARRGIDLIVMPTPVKPGVHPERLTGRTRGGAAIARNPSYRSFVEELTGQGVLVFDVAVELEEMKRATAEPLYFATDTHWRPKTVELVAERLASFIDQHTDLPGRPPTLYWTSQIVVTSSGDTTRLLDLPAAQTAYPAETVTLRQIASPDGVVWRADRDADVLLLGDSFTNVFSVDEMGWGNAAGLAEQLSFALQRPVDRIARNDNGAHASREALATELGRGRDRLAGKRLVVLQFANRELGQGDWRVVDLTLTAPPDLASFVSPQPGLQLEVRGVVAEIGPVPRPRLVPYRDHIVGVHLTKIRAETTGPPVDGTEALVYLWSMQDDELTPVADFGAGDPIHLRLEPWASVADDLDGINRGEVGNLSVRFAEPWWGQLVEDAP